MSVNPSKNSLQDADQFVERHSVGLKRDLGYLLDITRHNEQHRCAILLARESQRLRELGIKNKDKKVMQEAVFFAKASEFLVHADHGEEHGHSH